MFSSLSSKCKLKIQSSDVNITTMQIGSEHTENSDHGNQIAIPRSVKTVNSDLNRYLNRPVLVKTINWEESDGIEENIYPWYLYFNHTSIRKRIDNYAFLKCKLNIRVVVTASPFYYGACQVSYRPYADEGVCPTYSSFRHRYLSNSQRPSFNIYPQQSMGGDMQLPFMFHKEYANVTTATDLNLLGQLTIISLTTLMNANSVSGEAATIQIFAWAEDVELSGPTINLALQSRDEYTGIISKPASSLAYWSGQLASLPIIGKFATATSLASGSVAAIASLFGYTNVPNIEKQAAFKPTSTPLLATTDIGVAVEKLTLDSKNELTIDNTAYSCGDEDPLLINSMCKRESYLTQFSWTAATPPQTLLWNSRVTPNMYASTTIEYGADDAVGTVVSMTPMCMVANLFQYWRGDIKFRFVFLCSQYHRGKVRVVWDPTATIGADPSVVTGYTEVFNKVIDLSIEQDVSITVPYNQATAFLRTSDSILPESSIYDSGYVVPATDNNGILSVVILNRQTSPIASADIKVLVYVSAPDIDFETPKSLTRYFSPYPLQSKDSDLSNPSSNNLFETSGDSSHLNLVYMGEKVMSLRQIMRRANFIMNLGCTDFYQDDTYIESSINRMPLYPGFDPNGIATVYKVGTPASTAPFNYVQYSTLNWITQCFVGYRGSVIWNVNVTGPNIVTTASVTRYDGTLTVNEYIRAENFDSTSENNIQYNGFIRNKHSQKGTSLVNGRTQQALGVLVPWYSQYKFAVTTPLSRTLGDSSFATNTDAVRTAVVVQASATQPASRTALEFYCGAGTDFDPVFFLNVPVLYYTTALPSPVY